MALRNEDFNAIMRNYDVIASENRAEHDARVLEIKETVPEIAAIDNEIINTSVSYARMKILRKPDDGKLSEKLAAFKAKKEKLLIEAGYPADYLEPIYTCKECKDTGFINGKKCRCFTKAVIDKLYDQSNIKDILKKENFQTFDINYFSEEIDSNFGISPRENMENVLKAAHNLADNIETEHGNMLLYGGIGVGKTFLSNCIAKQVIDKGLAVLYLSAESLMEIFENVQFNKGDKDDSQMEGLIFDCDLLIIDDLGTEFSNNFTDSRLFTCINERILKNKSTVISTNLSTEKIRDRYSERIFSRIISNYTISYVMGEDIRIKKVIS